VLCESDGFASAHFRSSNQQSCPLNVRGIITTHRSPMEHSSVKEEAKSTRSLLTTGMFA
jgi:hypothetical protein